MSDKKKRNDPCPCGSGKKYKKCCGAKKNLNARNASVINSSPGGSLFDRIRKGNAALNQDEPKESSLKDRITKNLDGS